MELLGLARFHEWAVAVRRGIRQRDLTTLGDNAGWERAMPMRTVGVTGFVSGL